MFSPVPGSFGLVSTQMTLACQESSVVPVEVASVANRRSLRGSVVIRGHLGLRACGLRSLGSTFRRRRGREGGRSRHSPPPIPFFQGHCRPRRLGRGSYQKIGARPASRGFRAKDFIVRLFQLPLTDDRVIRAGVTLLVAERGLEFTSEMAHPDL